MASDIDRNLEKYMMFRKWYDDPATFFVDIYKAPYNVTQAFEYQAKIMRMLKDFDMRRLMILAAGTTGKTITLGAVALWCSVVLPKFIKRRYDTVIISGSEDQARSLYEYSKTALELHPMLKDEVMGEIRMTHTQFKDRSVIRALPNSLKAIQGKHAPFVIVDEAALAGDFVINDTKRIIGAFDPNRVILSGTPMDNETGATGELFIDMFEDPERYPEWKRITWSAYDCPAISSEMREEAKSLPEREYQIFWLGKPYVSARVLIPRGSLKDAILDYTIGYNSLYNVYCGVDWGHAHPTAVVFVQLTPDNKFEVIETNWFKGEEFDKIHDWIESRARYYKTTKIYTDGSDVGENQRLLARGLPVFPIQFNKEKGFMQSRLRDIFTKGRIKMSDNEQKLIQELRTYTWDKKINDDMVDALQLAVREDYQQPSNLYFKLLKSHR